MGNIDEKPKVGVGVMIFRGGKILMGKRKGSHGEGEYSFPGGHLEYMEGFEECAQRETFEETGIKIKNIKFLGVSNVVKYVPKHYVNIKFTAEWESGEPKVCEPDKFENWEWYGLDNLPTPIFKFAEQMINLYKSGKNYYDKE